MGSAVRLGRIFGIEIGIDYSWFLVFLLFTWTFAAVQFPMMVPHQTPATYWSMGAAASVLFFACVLAHELSHSVVSIRSGIPVRRIDLFLFGGMAQIARDADTPGQELRIAAAGPAASFVLGILLVVAADLVRPLAPLAAVLGFIGFLNVVLGLFNLLPGFPLDGGRILRALVWHFNRDRLRATRAAATSGKVVAYLLMLVGVYQIMLGNLIGGIWFILIGWFLVGAADSSYRQLVLERALKGVRVEEVMTGDPVTVDPDVPVELLVDQYFLRYRHGGFPVVDRAGHALGLVELNAVRQIPRERWPYLTTSQVMEPDAEVDPGTPILQVLERIGQKRLLVVHEGTLVGILSSSDLARFLHVHGVLGGVARS
ncbi:MAG: site-2 protease family protein [Thermaerobacter sp.]|nr:site-2 protease family protein [Thermaerobacter sp.]